MEFLKTIGMLIGGTLKLIFFIFGTVCYGLCTFGALFFIRPPMDKDLAGTVMLIGTGVLLLTIFWVIYYVHLVRLDRVPENFFSRYYPTFNLQNRVLTVTARFAVILSIIYWVMMAVNPK